MTLKYNENFNIGLPIIYILRAFGFFLKNIYIKECKAGYLEQGIARFLALYQ